jgi:hypothetical protein
MGRGVAVGQGVEVGYGVVSVAATRACTVASIDVSASWVARTLASTVASIDASASCVAWTLASTVASMSGVGSGSPPLQAAVTNSRIAKAASQTGFMALLPRLHQLF